MQLFMSLFLIFIMSSCGDRKPDYDLLSSNDFSSTGDPEKSLFSTWIANDGTRTTLDFRRGAFRRGLYQSLNVDLFVTCECFLFVTGDELAGNISVNHCVDRAGNAERFDCRKLEDVISYNKRHSILRLTCLNQVLCKSYE